MGLIPLNKPKSLIADKNKTIDIEYIRSIWTQFCERIRKEKMVLANTLSKAVVTDFKNGMLYIDIESQLQYNSITENQAFINETFSKYLKQPIRILAKVRITKPSEAKDVLDALINRTSITTLKECLSNAWIEFDKYGILGLGVVSDESVDIISKQYFYLIYHLKEINDIYKYVYVFNDCPF